MVMMAPFETFLDHTKREKSGKPYDDVFIKRCRAKALEYDKEDVFLRDVLLRDLEQCLPLHRRAEVFEGISFQRKW